MCAQLEKEKKCEQCHEKEYKYKCPGCLLRTCSLECSKRHKEETGCKGVRDRTKFVKRAEYNENTMMSDYGFLQDILREHNNAIKIKKESKNRFGSGGRSVQRTPLTKQKHAVMQKAKSQRNVMIRYMNTGIQRSRQNRTLWSSSKCRLIWTIEFSIPEIECVPNKWVDNMFHDVCKIGDLWLRLLQFDPNRIGSSTSPDTKNKNTNVNNAVRSTEKRPFKRIKNDQVLILLPSNDGKEYPFASSISTDLLNALKEKFSTVPVENLVWLIKMLDVPANKPTFYNIDPSKPLYTQLQYLTVLEFPTIYVYANPPSEIDGYSVTIREIPSVSNDESESKSSSGSSSSSDSSSDSNSESEIDTGENSSGPPSNETNPGSSKSTKTNE